MLDTYNNIIKLVMANSNNVVFVILVLSIIIVFISILYVLLQAPRNSNSNFKTKKLEKKTISKTQVKGKTKKVKYTKEFLKRVEGLDLELKENVK